MLAHPAVRNFGSEVHEKSLTLTVRSALTAIKTFFQRFFNGIRSICHHNKLATTESQIAFGGDWLSLCVACRMKLALIEAKMK